jgi:hypothetical protein
VAVGRGQFGNPAKETSAIGIRQLVWDNRPRGLSVCTVNCRQTLCNSNSAADCDCELAIELDCKL